MKNNLKTTLIRWLACVGMFALTSPVFASTAILSPADISTNIGQVFNVVVSIDPQGMTDYAEKIQIDYPVNLLEESSFSLGANWMAISQPGYDLTDNNNGTIIKTAGYPGGISSPTIFGIITFHAKNSGNGIIKINGNSTAFDVGNQKTISGNNVYFNVTTPSIPVSVPVSSLKTKTPIYVAPQLASSSQSEQIPQQTAAVINAYSTTTTGSTGTWAWVLIIIVILVLIWGIYMFSKKDKIR